MTTQTIPRRDQVAAEHTWNAESVFSTAEDWEAEFARVEAHIPELARFGGHLGDGPAALAEWLAAADELGSALGKLQTYAVMAHAVDAGDQQATARYDRFAGLVARALAATSFAEPEMLALGGETLRSWAQSDARLTSYEHYFDQLARRVAHVRSAEVEELLGMVSEPFAAASGTHGVLANADLRYAPARGGVGETLEVTQGTVNALLSHADREIRRTAWESYADAHLAVRHTMASCLAAGVKQQVFQARARRYPSALEASLSASHIPVAVFHNLIETYRRNLPTWHRYWRIRRQALSYDKLYVYDIKAPLTARPPTVAFERAMEWIAAGMRPLGSEYIEVMREGALKQRWVDIYPNQGKRLGAFSSGAQGTHPFILMSYTDDIFSMSTLAHELGHSMHSYYTWQNQPPIYSDYSLFVAEVASNFNQAMVRAHLLELDTDPDFQIAVIEEAMANFHRYFFIMPTLARFELEIHERIERGEALTADGLIGLMADLFREGYGDEVEMDTERVGITWGQFATHMYSNFYVYQYATGISGAHALAEGVLAGRPGAAENYLAFLRAGGSLYPLDALQRAGVDLATPAPVEHTFGVLAQLVDRLERALAQRQ